YDLQLAGRSPLSWCRAPAGQVIDSISIADATGAPFRVASLALGDTTVQQVARRHFGWVAEGEPLDDQRGAVETHEQVQQRRVLILGERINDLVDPLALSAVLAEHAPVLVC